MLAILLGLAVTLAAPPANTLDSEAVIADLITKQRELAAIYDTLSYTATLESTVQEDFQEAPLRTTLVYTVSHRRGTTLVNCVSSLSIKEIEQRENGVLVDSKYEVEHTPTEQRLLLNDRVQVYWPNTNDVGVQSVQRPRSGGGGFLRNMAAYMSDSSLRAQCFGANSPFFERYAQRPAFVRWEARTVSDSTDIQVLRTIEVGPGKEKQDLIYQLDSVHGLLRSALFRPGGSTSDTFR